MSEVTNKTDIENAGLDLDLADLSNRSILGRRALERLDLLFLAVESLDFNGSEAILFNCEKLGLQKFFPNRVELWKSRCHNPLRRTTRRGKLESAESDALIMLLCSMADRIYPLIHQLLSSREPEDLNFERWNLMESRLEELIRQRMNPRRGAVQRLLSPESSKLIYRDLVRSLALAAGPGGINRLRASLLDPTP